MYKRKFNNKLIVYLIYNISLLTEDRRLLIVSKKSLEFNEFKL